MSSYEEMDISSDKGKGKAQDPIDHNPEEEEEEEESSDEEATGDDGAIPEDADEDDFGAIDASNIITGQRTRGVGVPDYSQVDQEGLDDDDDDEDDDFQEKQIEADSGDIDDDQMRD